MTAPKKRRTLASLLTGSLLLCAVPQNASSQQSEEAVQHLEQVYRTCGTAPAEQAVLACEVLGRALSQKPDSPLEARLRVNARWSDVLVELGRDAEAEAPARKAAAAAQETKDRSTIAAQQNRLAGVLKNLGRHSEAEALLRIATELLKKEYGAEAVQVAAAMGNLAGALQPQGKFKEAESLLRKALVIEEKKLDPDDPSLAATLGNLAGVLRAQGKHEVAESLYRKALAIEEKKLAPDDPSLALTLGNLAGVVHDLGRFMEAESLLRKALAVFEKKLAPDHPSHLLTVDGLATVLSEQGKLAEAESVLRKALAIKEQKLALDDPSLALTLANLAAVLSDEVKLVEAESLYRKAMAIFEKKLAPDHPFLATTLANLAEVLGLQGKLAEAESLYRKAMAIFEKKLAPDHPSLATTLGGLAGVLRAQGKLAAAESLYRKALAIQEKKLGPDHPSLTEVRSNLSYLHLAQTNLEAAVTEQQKRTQSFDRLLRTSLTEDVAEALLAAQSADERVIYGLPLLPGAPPEAAGLAMSTALLFKGRTLEAGRMVRRALRQGLKTEEQRLKYQKMLALLGQRDQELARMTQGGGSREKAQDLLWQAQKLERELSKDVGVQSSADVPTLADVTQQVAQHLPHDAVLVEFGLGITADYSRGSIPEVAKTAVFHYVALMLFPSGAVRVVRLGGKADVEGATQTLLAALSQSTSDILPAAKSAYATLFAPLEKELGGVHQVILSPDGALGALPFGALHDGRGYLVDRLSFRYVSSGRDVLNPPSRKPPTQPAVLMATRVPGQEALNVAERVGKALAQTLGAKLTEQATDGHVLAQERPRVLTLISHGYFGGESKGGGMSARLPTSPKRAVRSRYLGTLGFERDDAPQAKLVIAAGEQSEELMNSSGLLMMAGLQASTDPTQDGRLTAVEVREMNLQGTQLVLLLACKGATGGLSFGQGVYGLRRAVLQAGAETVVGTLWSVEEKSASELAKNYMTKLWTDKAATRVGAMEEAMQQLRKDRRYRHPHYWAPFVVMGMDGALAL